MWTFYDFLDANGENVIDAWLDDLSTSQPKKVRARLEQRVTNLQQMPRSDWRDQIGAMTGPGWEKLFHMRFTFQNVQYRPLLCYVPGELAMAILVGATEKGGEILPRNARAVAQERRTLIEGKDWRTHVIRHDEA